MNAMRNLIVLLAFCAATATYARESKDTLVIDHPDRVTVIDNDSLLKVQVNGRENDKHYSYSAMLQTVDSNYVSTSTIGNDWGFNIGGIRSSKEKKSYHSIESHLFLGLVSAPGAADNLPFNTQSSWELWWLITDYMDSPWRNDHFLSVGFGIDWRNYRMTGRQQFVKGDDGILSVAVLPQGSEPMFSSIKVFSLTFPLRYHYYKKGWGFSVGPVVNINTYSSIKTRYKLDGEKMKNIAKNVHHQPITVDFMATFTNPFVDLYVKYSPCNVLDQNYGFKFQSLSFGIYF